MIHAAGVISVGQECLMRKDYFTHCDTHSLQRWVDVRIEGIVHRLRRIFQLADAQNCSTDLAARRLAIQVLNGNDQADVGVVAA